MRAWWGVVWLGAGLWGCYDLRGGSVNDAATREGAVADVLPVDDVVAKDRPSPMDVFDAASTADAPADVGADVFDVSEDRSEDVAADLSVTADIIDASVDGGPPPCPSGQTRCGDACVDTLITPTHCGMCGMACPSRANAAPTCVMGACRSVCNTGFADCDNDPTNGCEAAFDRAENCGACGTRCQGGTPLCQESAGTHRCVSGCSGAASTRCGMSCVDTQSDLQHCGMCDNACPVPTNGRATCAAATCGIACNTGYHVCGTSCADDRAVETCGALCSPCPARANATTTCNAGSCGFTCNAGFGDCDGNANNGCESVLGSTLAHCGRCGNACPTRANATSSCTMGVCGSSCNSGFTDCDGDASNGCEASLAGSGYSCSTCAAGAWCGTTRSCSVDRCSPVQSWVRFGGSMAPACAAITAVGTVVSAGTFRNPTDFGGGTVTPRGFDVYVVAHNRDGSTRWHRTFGGVGNDDISRVALDAEGNIYACGSFTGAVDFGDGNTLTSASGSQDAFVLSLSPAGVLRWVRALGGTGREVSQGIAVSASGRVAVSGVTESQTFSPPATVGPTGTAGGQDGFVVTFDQSGTHQWTRILGGTGEDGAYGVGVGALGETAVSAQVASSVTLNGTVTTGDTDAALIVFEPTGSVRWAQRFATPGVNYGRNVAIDASGNIAFLLESEAASMGILGTPLSAPGHIVASFTSAGVRRWAQSIIGAGVGGAGFALSTDARGDVLWSHHAQAATLVVGSDSLALGSGQAIIAFTDLGAPRWARRIDGDSPWCVASRSGVVAIGGSSGIVAFDASATCPMGVCSFTCDPGLADCDGDASNGCEADLASPSNCGACDRRCDVSQVCVRSECVSPTRTGAPVPDARTSAACAWTGSEFLLWGGANESRQATGTGFRYSPQTNAWRPMSAAGAPGPRIHVDNGFAWTGQRLFVWGGADISGSTPYANGALYNPALDTWSPIASTQAPSARALFSGQWTGSEVLVWGGNGAGGLLGDGARFELRSNQWAAMSSSGAPTSRSFHQAVWTGSEYIVWGGADGTSNDPVTGGRYDPATDRWRPMSTAGAPRGRHLHSMVWTGREVLVWGGATRDNASVFGDGARYTPSDDRWTAISSLNAPSARQQHATVWTGGEMIVWGGWGANLASVLTDAAAYDPLNDRWRPIRGTGVPGAGGACFQWTGTEMLVAGGRTGLPVTASMVRVTPAPRYFSLATPRATDRGLIAHYEFEGDLRDSGGVHGAGTGFGVVQYGPGRFGRALRCNGADTRVRIPALANSAQYTVAVAVSPSAPLAPAWIVDAWDSGREFFYLSLGVRMDGVHVVARNHLLESGRLYTELGAIAPSPVVADAWFHVALTFGGDVLRLYVDGNLVASEVQSRSGPSTASEVPAGVELCGSERTAAFLRGAIDDLRIYDRALSAEEIRLLQ